MVGSARSFRGLAVFVGVFAALLAPAAAERDHEFCERLSQLTRGLEAGTSREITFRADASEPTNRSCQRHEKDYVADSFCAWFVTGASIDLMEGNLWKVVACVADVDVSAFPVDRDHSMSGVLRFDGARLVSDVAVNVEVEYLINARGARATDTLRISIAGR